MLRKYSRTKVIFNKLGEWTFFILLYPFILAQKSNRKDVTHILLVEPFQMGDILSLTPLIEPLRKRYPQSKISFLTKPGSGKILEYDSRINKVFTVDFPWSDHGKKKLRFGRTLRAFKSTFNIRKYNFDIGIDTRGDVRSQALLILSGCRTRLGYLNYLHSNLSLSGLMLTDKLQKSKYYHRYEWNLDLLSLLGFNESDHFPIRFPAYNPDKLNENYAVSGRYFVIHVGGGWEYRRWSNLKWIGLITHLQKIPNIDNLVIVGGPGEAKLLQEIEAFLHSRDNVNFKTTTFEELVLLINGCSQFIGLDSGPMNLSVCLNKPTLALFGPGDEKMWRPLNANSGYIKKTDKFPCSPCLQLNCIFPMKNCMHEIVVEDVLSKLKLKILPQ